MMISSRWLVGLVAVLALLASCGSSDSADSEGDQESRTQPSVEEILDNSATVMGQVTSASFVIEQTGATVFIDDAGQLAFETADGRYASPSSAEALITVEALGFSTQVGAIAIDGVLWFTNPLTGDWTEAPDSFTFDPATLFDPDVGWRAALADASGNATLIGVEGDRYHIRAALLAERLSVLTGGLVDDATDVDLWIDVETGLVSEAGFELTLDDGQSVWAITLSDYNTPITIEPPELG